MKRQIDTAWGAGLILALALLLFGILVVAPGFAQQTVSAEVPVSLEAAEKSEARGSTGPEAAQKSDSSGNAIAPDDVDVRAALRAEQRERKHGFALVNKDIENLKAMFQNIDRNFFLLEIFIALVGLVVAGAGVLAGIFSFQAKKRAIAEAQKGVNKFIEEQTPEMQKRVEEIAREAAQNVLKWAQEGKRAEEKVKPLESKNDFFGEARAGLAMHSAALIGDVRDIERIAAADHLAINARDEDGDTPLIVAVLGKAPESSVEKLVALGADISAKNKRGITPLHAAAASGIASMVSLLVAKSANINVKDKEGDTPLHMAAANNADAIISLLVEKGANINAQDDDGDTPLLVAAYSNASKAIEKLVVECKADVKLKNKKDYTPLHVIAARGIISAVAPLLDRDADVNAQDEDGDTPLDVAVGMGKYDVADMLQKRGGKRGKEL